MVVGAILQVRSTTKGIRQPAARAQGSAGGVENLGGLLLNLFEHRVAAEPDRRVILVQDLCDAR
jgi:hypothetical protein